jgi:uncharacterized protein YqjF (DUF2071 family)
MFTRARQAREFRAVLTADWVNALFIHYAVDPAKLQPFVPFPLDTRDGTAYVSLVAFTQRRLRPTFGGKLAAALSRPLAEHEFLNVRTYVKSPAGDGEIGIYFIAEWIPNRLAALLGPPMYGLPYRVGKLKYTNAPARRETRATVAAPGGKLEFYANYEGRAKPARVGSLTEFLVERYTAWTFRGGDVARRFRIRHEAWDIAEASVEIHRSDLLNGVCAGQLTGAKPIASHFSRGTFDVRLGPPRRCARRGNPHSNEDRLC